MKKKLLAVFATLLAVGTLAACSSQKSTDTTKSSTEQTSEKSSTKESSTEGSSTAATLKESTVTYLTDEQIDAVQTIGDYKAAYTSLTASYVADFDELIAQLSPTAQEALKPYREQVVTMLDQQKATLDEQFASVGDDSTAIPEEARATVLDGLKSARDMLKQTMETVRSQAGSLL